MTDAQTHANARASVRQHRRRREGSWGFHSRGQASPSPPKDDERSTQRRRWRRKNDRGRHTGPPTTFPPRGPPSPPLPVEAPLPPFRSKVGRPASFHPFFRATVAELGFLSSPTGPSPGIQAKAWCPSRPPSHGKASIRRRGPRRRDGCTCVISEQQWLTFSKPMAAAFSLKHWRQMSI